jgi:hypothetical protein
MNEKTNLIDSINFIDDNSIYFIIKLSTTIEIFIEWARKAIIKILKKNIKRPKTKSKSRLFLDQKLWKSLRLLLKHKPAKLKISKKELRLTTKEELFKIRLK